MGRMKHGFYLIGAAGLLIYALPRLEMGQGFTLANVFGIVWLCMMLLIIAAQLHELIGVNEQKRKELERIKRYKKRRVQQWVASKVNAYSGSK